jgi:hypothetical protein
MTTKFTIVRDVISCILEHNYRVTSTMGILKETLEFMTHLASNIQTAQYNLQLFVQSSVRLPQFATNTLRYFSNLLSVTITERIAFNKAKETKWTVKLRLLSIKRHSMKS